MVHNGCCVVLEVAALPRFLELGPARPGPVGPLTALPFLVFIVAPRSLVDGRG